MTDNFSDLDLDSNNEVYIGPRGGLAPADKQTAFENKLRMEIQEAYLELIGDQDEATIVDLLEVRSREVADRLGFIERVAAIAVDYPSDDPNTASVKIIYETGDEFEFSVQG
jgi:hypothetical protein